MRADLILVLCILGFFGIMAALTLIPVIKQTPHLRRKQREEIAQLRAAAESFYRAHRVPSNDPRFGFDPDTATVIVDEETLGRMENCQGWIFRMERIVRNVYGEYFKIIYGVDGLVRFTHIEHRIAKIVLKDRYQAPGE